MTETLTRQDVPTDPEPDEPRKVAVADVLERAADLLGEYGWCQGVAARDASGTVYDCKDAWLGDEFCAAGALALAQRDLTGAYSHDEHWIYMKAAYPGGEIAYFNDSPGRTRAEVQARLRAAASSARTKEEA